MSQIAQKSEQTEKLENAKPKEIEWGYDASNGPDSWVKQFPIANGKHQSPIDIQTRLAQFDVKLVSRPLEFHYDNDCFDQITNTGKSFNVTGLANSNSRVIGGPVYHEHKFLQFHMHWGSSDTIGSEHLIDGRSYAAEIHFVNWNSEKYSEPGEAVKSNNHDGLIVLGVLVQVGAHNVEFDKIIPALNEIALKGKKSKLRHRLDYTNLFPSDTANYWTYEGSLTTPPCTECVQWVVFKTPIQISHKQLKAFHNLYSCQNETDCCDRTQITTNFRPTCELNERKIFKSFDN